MALVERLMGIEEPRIPVHQFFAAVGEVVQGNITGAQVKSFLNMDAAAQAEWDAMAATQPGPVANKAVWVSHIHAVFLLAETWETGPIPGYSTPAEVRTKLGI